MRAGRKKSGGRCRNGQKNNHKYSGSSCVGAARHSHAKKWNVFIMCLLKWQYWHIAWITSSTMTTKTLVIIMNNLSIRQVIFSFFHLHLHFSLARCRESINGEACILFSFLSLSSILFFGFFVVVVHSVAAAQIERVNTKYTFMYTYCIVHSRIGGYSYDERELVEAIKMNRISQYKDDVTCY